MSNYTMCFDQLTFLCFGDKYKSFRLLARDLGLFTNLLTLYTVGISTGTFLVTHDLFHFMLFPNFSCLSY